MAYVPFAVVEPSVPEEEVVSELPFEDESVGTGPGAAALLLGT